ncbi:MULTISPECIES: hypothetical protein [unclassified Lactococcus]|uniref:hypothetical protein n=1 Tax=unclassified Lactococcus TaxID=2643510 RepID=UPI0011CC600B|nr:MULTISPECIES: hypothetical protein [unclassified Lactococcus]MQW22700.1 hypothetical protein [Lactococcus sp. dk101]TXK44707.1 hypothetical protein FVP42_03655 [Lactococcus sp. dk310]TXK50601.1 hypothetical protein FVP43_03655 [Lactococcus sp. dk322]
MKKSSLKVGKSFYILSTLICLGPSASLLLNTNGILNMKQIGSIIISIPMLLILGFIFGRGSRDKEVMILAKEADELEAKLTQSKRS